MRHHNSRAPVQAQAHASLCRYDHQAPLAATTTVAADALETDIHVLTLRDFLAEQPLDWCLPPALHKPSPSASVPPSCDAQTACPESPCSVTCVVPPQLAPAAFCGTQSTGLKPVNSGAACYGADEILPLWMLQHGENSNAEYDDDDCEYDNCNRDDAAVKCEHPAYCQQQQSRPRGQHLHPQSCSLYGSSDVGKERLRKRQRAYEQKYRKKKRVTFKQMRREWLYLETLLYSHQAQRAHSITTTNQDPKQAALQDQLAQSRHEQKALKRDYVLLYTAWKWQELFAIQTQEAAPKFPATMREWELLADTALGLSYTKPFVPPRFTFTW